MKRPKRASYPSSPSSDGSPSRTTTHGSYRTSDARNDGFDNLEKARKEAEAEATRSAEARAEAERSALAQQRKTGVAEKTLEKPNGEPTKWTRRISFFSLWSLSMPTPSRDAASHWNCRWHHTELRADDDEENTRREASHDGQFVETLGKIALQASQIESSSRFATKAGFNTQATRITTDIVAFIREYVENVCSEFIVTRMGQPMRFDFSNADVRLVRPFRPLEVVVLIDTS